MALIDINQLSEEEMQEYARGFGEFLARLLVASTLSDEQKEAWAALVPEMTLEQMGRLAVVLEKYVDAAMLPEVADLRAKLEAVKAEYDAKLANLNKATEAQLADVLNQVKAAESAATV